MYRLVSSVLANQAYHEGVYTVEKHLFYLAMETWIYERCKTIGMLSTYVKLFYPFQAEDKLIENIPIEKRKVSNIKNS